jgi:upstream activation factor subunit UAF30
LESSYILYVKVYMETIIEDLIARISTLETKMVRQEKTIRKLKKDLIPESERKPRKPSGFAKPAYLSPELCLFLGVDVGTELARTDVTKKLLSYVKEHNLQNPENKRVILLDDALNKLLKPDCEVTYFNIQRLLKGHYVNPANEVTVAVVDAVEVTEPEKKQKAKKVKKTV